MSIFFKLSWFFKKYKKTYFIGILFLFIVNLLQLIPPKMLGIFTDKIIAKNLTWTWLLLFLAVLLLIYIGMYISRFIFQTHIVKGAALLELNLRKKLFSHYMKMDANFYQKYRTGDLMALSSNDISSIQRVASGGVLMVFDSTTVIIMTLIAMFLSTDWRLVLAAVIPLPLIAVGVSYISPRLRKAFTNYQDQFSKMSDHAQESFLGMKVIKTLGQEQEDIASFEQEIQQQIKNNKKTAHLDALFDPLATIVITVSYLMLIIVGGNLVLQKEITVGSLVTFTGYVGNLIWPMFALGQLFNLLERGNSSYDRVSEVLQEETSIKDDPNGISSIKAGDLDINIKSFSFSDDPNTAILSHIVASLKKGQTLGLVGQVGSGKTSLLRLIMREFDNYNGVISYNGIDIKKYKLSKYLGVLGYVSQDNFLFSTTIKENISFINPKLSLQKVQNAAKTAALHDDVLQMPNKYDTVVGENGISLSGGQRQRLSIARAIISDPDILILDDALSAVDAKTEKEILNGLKKNRQDKTTIISASRISSVVNADEILVFKNGKIIERGKHKDLITKTGWYSKTFHQQELATQYENKIEKGEK
ncbi:MAG: ABC transporter ATP-binding protein/permease [Lactobacillaceae bacterium]|jgi:ATP-binding cassette subfamily B protein/ATP-binding cassette subfamily C protein|nr:ABC transporter ATP-binding protein/permease [Lactobacillaceae bacterium]